ncbi:transcription cofactor vestigial-like protein 1 [Sardina pilchardus]|uniref:transcription cofactor vestigial-like protein 1 n=1 Tax=Sardina pilchardus TaxID=27697 RepID=UPI002E0FDB09
MENLRGESVAEASERKAPQRVLFTYYQGDINSVVDEHFSRALKKASLPKDLSTKASSPRDPHVSKPRSRTKGIKTEPQTSPTWNLSSPDWSKSPFPSSSGPGLAQFSSAESPVASQGVIMGPGGLSSSVWSYPTRPGAGFDLPMLYPPAGPTESSSGSFLSMLHMDRPAGGVVMAPKVESPDWDSPSAFRDSVGNRISLDSGVQVPEKTKDLYWY